MTFVSELSPQPLWQHFDRILEIPRASKDEGQVRQYLLELAAAAGLDQQVDAAGNLVVRKPASPGHEEAPPVILQAHLDMVQEKNSDVDFDFGRDAIQPRRDDGYLTATGTTLGSDNGIGVAAMLAVMEDSELVHGPLELLFTVDEESGLTGASGLGEGMLEGRRLLNLDSEEEGVLTIGCAGGADSELSLPLASSPVASGHRALTVRVSGLKGGHSGVDIHLQRGNALAVLARALVAAGEERSLRVARLEGGNAHNAIPRESHATVVVAPSDRDSVVQRLERELEAVAGELAPTEPGFTWEVADAETPAEAWEKATTSTALRLLVALPHGVMTMSRDIEGLVETSTNLATARARDGRLVVLMSSRSSVATALAALTRVIRATAELAGAAVEEGGGYPGWKPDVGSPLLEVVRRIHQEVLGEEAEVGAIHAGLECGIIGEKYPGMDMISFGPQIEFPHSPDERVKIDSVERFWRLLTGTLEELA